MARQEFAHDATGQAPAGDDGEAYMRLGLMYSSGHSVPLDYIEAQKWFHVAVARGCRAAMAHRSELAAEMSNLEAADAQRAARRWLQLH